VHLQANGYTVKTVDVADMDAVKRHFGVAPQFEGCHTATVDGYLLEGHVPADLIGRLLKERPEVAGLSVPGMPVGSPGMEVPGRQPEPYDVLAFDKDGRASVYAHR
jgi:hypothetical protein